MNAMQRKIVVFRTKLLPYSETFIKEQVLSYQQWSPILVGQFSLSDGIDLKDVNYATFEQKYNKFYNFKRNVYKLIGFSPYRDYDILNNIKPDIIHVHFGVDAVVNWPLLRKIHVPLIITLHGYDITIDKSWWKAGKEGIHLKKYPEKLNEIAKYENVQFLAVSQAVKEKAIEFGIPSDKIKVSYIGIDLLNFSVSTNNFDNRKQILFIGRLVEKKGAHVLLDAFSKIKDKFPEHIIKFIGDGPLKPQLHDQAQTLGVNAKFLGACSKETIIEELQSTSVFCLPSIRAKNGDSEGFGLVILEAAACGVPVVTSALGGATEGIVHGKTGFRFDENNSDELALYLDTLLSDPHLMKSMGQNGRDFVEKNFDINKCTRSLETIYEDILNGC
ncbi:MAG: glycosyltransferase [Enterobacter sp.]|uniref:glycosyltransferase n=1 Tax=Enterobacter sp. TaxID=42895 RepID=UPI00258735A2|nr:glycosyltransferase [Enterobacter sp.]MCI8905451.1 glycosyltransferase [Enterobacter sp.]HDR2784654.1 glycosyltransferase [Enterobacter sichuanensis]